MFQCIPREQEVYNFWVNYRPVARQKIITLTAHRDKILGLLSTAGFYVGLKLPECQALNLYSYFSNFKLVITLKDTPSSFRCASTFKRIRTRHNDISSQLSIVLCTPNRRNLTGRGMAQSSARSKYKPRPVHLGFVVDKVEMGQFFSENFFFHLSVSFYQHSIRVYSPVTDAAQSVSNDSVFK